MRADDDSGHDQCRSNAKKFATRPFGRAFDIKGDSFSTRLLGKCAAL